MRRSPWWSDARWGTVRSRLHHAKRRVVSVTAWTVTFVIALIFTIMIGSNVAGMARAAQVGAVSWSAVVGVAIPPIIVLGFLSLLIATLSTVGIFLRLRTASLAEIQLRLAALEDMLSSGTDPKIS